MSLDAFRCQNVHTHRVTSVARNTTRFGSPSYPLRPNLFTPCILFLLHFPLRQYTMDRVSGLPEVPQSEPILPPHRDFYPQIPSSPPSVASDLGSGRKPRKPPTVTPRSFRRFFTPRSLLDSGHNGSGRSSRQALRALSSPAVNRLGPAFTRSSKDSRSKNLFSNPPEDFVVRTPSKKRKHSFSSAASPLQSSPLKKVRLRSPVSHDIDIDQRTTIREIDVTARGRHSEKASLSPPKRRPVSPITRSRALQTSGSLFMRTVGGSRANRLTVRSTAGASQYLFFHTSGLEPPLTFS